MNVKKFIKEHKAKDVKKRTIISVGIALNEAEKKINKPLQDAIFDDILPYIEYLRGNMATNTANLRISKLIQFYSWLFDETDEIKFNKLAKKLKGFKTKKTTKIKPTDIAFPDDIQKIINVATLERNKCIIATLWDGWLRQGELLALKVEDVKLNHDVEEVTIYIPDIEGCKTGSRTILCLELYPYVIDWLKCHKNPSPESPFIPLSPAQLGKVIRKAYKDAGIEKRSNPHMIRHSAITNAVIENMAETQIKLRAWGNLNTNMLSVYVHLSEELLAQGYRKAKGMSEGNNDIKNPLASKCVKCGRLIQHEVKDGQAISLCNPCHENKKLKNEMTEMRNMFQEMKQELKNATKQAMES